MKAGIFIKKRFKNRGYTEAVAENGRGFDKG